MKVHATVSPALPSTEIREQLCARRWARWKPIVTQWLRQHEIEPSVLEMECLRLRHRAHMIACQMAELPDLVIFQHQLDDPRRTDAERDTVMQPLLESANNTKHRKRIRRAKENMNGSHM